MPFAPKIRKDILHALDKFIIPMLQSSSVSQILAEPPFDFGKFDYDIAQKEWVEDKEFSPLQLDATWENKGVLASRLPTILFLYQGFCYEPIGVTQKLAQSLDENRQQVLGGVNLLKLRSPCILYLPPFALRGSGDKSTFTDNVVQDGAVLYCRAREEDVRISLNIRSPKSPLASHHLEVNDAELSKLIQKSINEMRAQEHDRAQFTSLTFALLLRQHLRRERIGISNSSNITPPPFQKSAIKVLLPRQLCLCENVTEHIVNHLHAKLSLQGLAHHFDISTVRLNYIFRQAHGTTVMRFVTRMRIEAAKPILKANQERFSDIAQLVGFASEDSFYNAFRREVGMSPREYQQKKE